MFSLLPLIYMLIIFADVNTTSIFRLRCRHLLIDFSPSFHAFMLSAIRHAACLVLLFLPPMLICLAFCHAFDMLDAADAAFSLAVILPQARCCLIHVAATLMRHDGAIFAPCGAPCHAGVYYYAACHAYAVIIYIDAHTTS